MIMHVQCINQTLTTFLTNWNYYNNYYTIINYDNINNNQGGMEAKV